MIEIRYRSSDDSVPKPMRSARLPFAVYFSASAIPFRPA